MAYGCIHVKAKFLSFAQNTATTAQRLQVCGNNFGIQGNHIFQGQVDSSSSNKSQAVNKEGRTC